MEAVSTERCTAKRTRPMTLTAPPPLEKPMTKLANTADDLGRIKAEIADPVNESAVALTHRVEGPMHPAYRAQAANAERQGTVNLVVAPAKLRMIQP